MAVRWPWPWWSVLLLLAAVVLPGATSARPEPSSEQDTWPAGEQTVMLVPASAATPEVFGPPAPADRRVAPSQLIAQTSSALPSLFEGAQVVSLYGYPDVPVMGDLGKYSPEEAALEVARLAGQYDAINGERGAIGAIHLIVGVAQPVPLSDGSYLNRLDHETIAAYVEAARAGGVLLLLDTQLGMVDPLVEARRLEGFLAEPFVHLALDPEFAMRASGGTPGDVIGSVDAAEVNTVQRYLGGLAREYALPPKLLIVHQFRADMLTHSEPWQDVDEVLLTINVDGWGDMQTKLETYAAFAMAHYAEYAGVKLFEGWDVPMMTPAQVLALPRVPDLIVYQ